MESRCRQYPRDVEGVSEGGWDLFPLPAPTRPPTKMAASTPVPCRLPLVSRPLTHLMRSLQEAQIGPCVSTDPASSPLPPSSAPVRVGFSPSPFSFIKINIHLTGFPSPSFPFLSCTSSSQGSPNPGLGKLVSPLWVSL